VKIEREKVFPHDCTAEESAWLLWSGQLYDAEEDAPTGEPVMARMFFIHSPVS